MISFCETYKTILPRYQFPHAHGAERVKAQVVWDKGKGARDLSLLEEDLVIPDK